MPRRMSFNVSGAQLHHPDYLAQFLAVYRPTTALIMDNSQLAYQVHDVTEGETLVIHRVWSHHEGKQWAGRVSPEKYVNQITLDGALKKHIWAYVLNEPVPDLADLKSIEKL